jgi:hypothetical protein
MLAAWLKSGVLFREEYRDKREGKDRIGLSVDPLKRPGARHA